MNRNIGRALLAYILSLISPAIAQAQPGDTSKAEGDWVIQSERPRAVAEAGERDLRVHPAGKARAGNQGEPDLDAGTLWGRRPDGKDGRQSESDARGTAAGVDRVSKSEPIAASGAISKDSGSGGRKSGGGSSGDKDSGGTDGGDTSSGDTSSSGTSSSGTSSSSTGERGAGDSGTGDSNDGGRSTGDRDQGSGGGGNSGSGGRDR